MQGGWEKHQERGAPSMRPERLNASSRVRPDAKGPLPNTAEGILLQCTRQKGYVRHHFAFRTSFLNQPRKAQAYKHGAAFPNRGAQFSC